MQVFQHVYHSFHSTSMSLMCCYSQWAAGHNVSWEAADSSGSLFWVCGHHELGTASGSGGSGITIRSYVQIGVSMLRKEAREIDSLWANKDEFVGEHVAARIARSINQYPTDSLVDQWILDAKRMHTQRKVLHEEKSASLRALAEEWEKRLISGALIQEDSGETGRHHKRQRKPSSGGLATISVSSAPSVSSASQAAQSEGSLRGTVLGSCVELPGMGSVPYVKLAIQKLRREAHNLIFRWQSIETYIRLRIVENMLEKKNRNPSPAQVWHWIALARQSYSRFGPLRTQEAADLNSVADDLETRASAAGLLVRSPQEAPVHGSELVRGQPAPASEGVSCGAEVTFAHLAIEHLRRQAEELDATWGSAEEHFVATRIAYRIARANAPPPHPGKQQEWAFQDRTTFRAARAVHQRKAQHIRDQADALEQELRDLLSSTPSRAAEPARESASTAGQSSELPSGKRRQKRKHLSPSGSGSFGEGPSRGGATLPPLSLWLTPVSTFRLWRRQRRLRTAQVTSGPGSASPASLQLHPTEAASEKASGHSLPTPVPATRSTGVPLPPAALALSTTTPLHPAGSGSSAGVPAAPQPKKRRLLDFVSAQAAAHQLAPQMHTPPPGQISGTSTQIPSEHLPLGPLEASGPSLTSFLSTGHATPFGPVSEIIPPRCLPLKKRPLREPAATIQSPTADVATSGPRRVSSDSLTVSSTSPGSHSQAPASTDSPAPTSAPHGVRGVGPHIRRGAPEPR
ncbi:KRUF family protein [Toxoplasma gondii ME49]|uniref:KRUF family protein n=1 Tax=Toxoplasma gondii (strain ATCC 50611 / Me49) TaxID=508771 RepID=S8GJ64_TOXGM|nr:KRUF family protein [Toxoplasma gondii ME49]EPT31890.1 KRUF family protein [Toxoplasma gondii ME49]|eukprot:XP_018638219.1 KRUF family protein [Toxoplasma gondii ME49]